MKDTFAPLLLVCNICDTSLVISIELIEYIISIEEEIDEEFEDEIDKILQGENCRCDMGYAPFPIGINEKTNIIYVIGWCRECHKIVMCPIGNFSPKLLGDGGGL